MDHARLDALTCSGACRNAVHRARVRAQRARLVADADRAMASGDLAALTAVARRTAALLRP